MNHLSFGRKEEGAWEQGYHLSCFCSSLWESFFASLDGSPLRIRAARSPVVVTMVMVMVVVMVVVSWRTRFARRGRLERLYLSGAGDDLAGWGHGGPGSSTQPVLSSA